MKKLFLFIVTGTLFSCIGPRFVHTNKFIDKLPKEIAIDSIYVLRPSFTMWWYSANGDQNHSLWQNGRPDSFIKRLTIELQSVCPSSHLEFTSELSCMDNKFIAGKWNMDDCYNYSVHACLPFKKGAYNVFVNTRMNVKESNADVSGREYESISTYLLMVKDSSVFYYKHFLYHRVARKTRFPKGSADRKDYPYFANDQIERVVKNIAADLIKRIGPAAK